MGQPQLIPMPFLARVLAPSGWMTLDVQVQRPHWKSAHLMGGAFMTVIMARMLVFLVNSYNDTKHPEQGPSGHMTF